mmetsp:Transcript_11626/g.16130  ORF Transcript_11626/g.16130 Transcript_11626/m.16130 type:complete len:730 (+) Transcript_11626:87-2276(+)
MLRFKQHYLVLIVTICLSLSCVFAAKNQYQTQYRNALSTENIKENVKNYTSQAHIAGSKQDFDTANRTFILFQEYGINNTRIEAINVTLSYPLNRTLLVFNSTSQGQPFYKATLEEPVIPEDEYSSLPAVPTFNGYSPSGNVTAPVIFVNYGSSEDYDALVANKVNVTGKIVIARYGKLFRGCKVMLAEMHGAVGVILYSDPNSDGIGYNRTAYPEGPWRPYESVQRGSVQYLSKCPGDPDRGHSDCTSSLPKIPVQPISAKDAEPIIANLMQTNTNLTNCTTYWGNVSLGSTGDITINLDLTMEFSVQTIWNVYGVIPGQEKDRHVLIGAHRDAWVFGGVDPVSGTATLLEIARGLGNLTKSGYKPKRTIILASWDGEEYGLLGSTYYGETYNETIREEAIAYLNLDTAVYGTNFSVDATPSLHRIIRQIAANVTQPGKNSSIAANWDGTINRLGSGSDYTVFIHYLGIPSATFSFVGDYGVYHSIYDSYTYVEKFMDPDFTTHRALAEYVGLLAMNISDASILPFNYTDYAHELSVYFNETEELLGEMGATSQVDLYPLEVAIKNFTRIAHNLDKEIKNINMEDALAVIALNDRMGDAELEMLYTKGLPNRPWYKHQIQAPGYYLGYGSQIFPGITESISERKWALANQYVGIVAERITACAGVLVEDEDSYGVVSSEDYTGYQVFMILFTVFIIGSFVAAIWYFRRSRKQYQKNHRYAMMEMDEQL